MEIKYTISVYVVWRILASSMWVSLHRSSSHWISSSKLRMSSIFFQYAPTWTLGEVCSSLEQCVPTWISVKFILAPCSFIINTFNSKICVLSIVCTVINITRTYFAKESVIHITLFLESFHKQEIFLIFYKFWNVRFWIS